MIDYNGKEYRVNETSPSRRYAVAQESSCPKAGRLGVFTDAPIDLFHILDGTAEYIDHAYCPLDALDGPYLSDIMWYEAEGFVKLVFSSVELGGRETRRIYFEKARETPKEENASHGGESLPVSDIDPEEQYIKNKEMMRRVLEDLRGPEKEDKP